MITLSSIEFALPTRIVFGTEVADRIGETAREYTDKVFLITDDGTMAGLGFQDKVTSLLEKSGIEYILYDKISRDPKNEVIDELGELVRQSRVKLVIGLGSASVINASKAACYLAKNPGKISEYLNGGIGGNSSVPLILIPTIPGVTQQLNNEFILKDNDNVKKNYLNPGLFPQVCLIDPKVTLSLPINYTVSSGFAILSNAIESFISAASNAISDSLSIKAIEIVGKNMKRLFLNKEDLTARSNIMMASVLTGLSLLTSKLGTCEAISMALSSREPIYKNIVHAIMLPYVMEFNLTAMPNKYVQIAKALGEDISSITVVEAAIKAIEGVRKLLFDLKVPQKLGDYKINKENLPIVSSIARRYSFINYAPLPLSKEDILNILMTAY
ncbi:MAG: iron-containing alcohol dehydrogenase [bacterium]|nr:iron-containing alcohol dehydrogenase [bacterium]